MLYTNNMRFGLFITSLFVFFLPTVVSAQSLGSLGEVAVEMFTISVSPRYPTPLSNAVISITSSYLNITNSKISVSVNGKEIYNGSVRPVSIQLGGAGSVTNVSVTVTSAGTTYKKTLSVQPQDVAIVVEPVSSAPVLYPGKPLVPIGGSVRVVAVANMRNSAGKIVAPETLSYSWTVDDTQIINSSGIGKDAIIVASPLKYRSRSVSVDVTDQNGVVVGGESVSISAQEPSIRIYQNDSLLGILYDHALSGSYTIKEEEDSLFATPFSFPTTDNAPLLKWFLNGVEAGTKNSITLRPAGSGQGSASLSIVASSGNSTMATENISLSFGAKTGGFSLFGL